MRACRQTRATRLATSSRLPLRIYFEGDAGLREGFRAFFQGLNRDVRLVALGSNWNKFERAKAIHGGEHCVLLRDAEGSAPPSPAPDEFFMVQLMESWFLADPEAVSRYFGPGGRAVPKRANVEMVSKARVEQALKAASSKTKKGDYFKDKVRHANGLLKMVSPEKARKASPHCERIFQALG